MGGRLWDNGKFMMTSYKLFSAFGIPIRIHLSLIALLGIVAALGWSMQESGASILFNLALLGIVFTSIALHELAHSLVAIRKGCRVREITLMFVGGAAQMEDIPRKPADEIQVALAGPLFSILLGALALAGGAYLPLKAFLPSLWTDHPINLLQFTGQINLTLAVFNLLPAFPMDGGRVFRALISRKIGFLPATFVASRLGRVFAIIMGIVGFRNSWWSLLIIAIFLFRAAGQEFDYVLRQELQDSMQKMNDWMRGGNPFASAPRARDLGGQVKISPPPYERGS